MTPQFHELRVAEVRRETPDGHFNVALDPSQARHYVAFVAGSGITPVLSIIRATLREEPRSRFTLVYGNRQQADVMFHEALEDLEDLKDRYLTRFRLYHVFSREALAVDLFNGRIDAARTRALLDSLIPADTIDHAFVCGPGAMIDDVETALIGAGVPRERIHAERFGSAGAVSLPGAPVQPGDAPCATVTVVLDGEVRMARNFSLDDRDLAAGFVLTCQAHPLTDHLTISFDDR